MERGRADGRGKVIGYLSAKGYDAHHDRGKDHCFKTKSAHQRLLQVIDCDLHLEAFAHKVKRCGIELWWSQMTFRII